MKNREEILARARVNGPRYYAENKEELLPKIRVRCKAAYAKNRELILLIAKWRRIFNHEDALDRERAAEKKRAPRVGEAEHERQRRHYAHKRAERTFIRLLTLPAKLAALTTTKP